MKRIISLSLVLLMLLASCKANVTDNGTDTQKPDESVVTNAFDYSDGITDDGMYDGVKATDYAKLCEYKGIKVPTAEHTITDEAVEKYMNSLLDDYTTVNHITDREVKNGDTVNIDYVGSVDGVEFEGGSTQGDGADVTIGVTSYIDDFLEQLVGHKPGETVNVEVTFPASYPQSPDLQNKDALFVTKINYICEAVVEELTDSFVEEKLSDEYGWKTVEEMRSGVKETLVNSRVRDFVRTYINENSEVDIPDTVYRNQKNAMLNYYLSSAQRAGMTLEAYAKQYMGLDSIDALVGYNDESLKESSRMYVEAQAIAELEGISATEDDVKQYLKDSVQGFNDASYDLYVQSLGIGYLKQSAMVQLVYKFVASKAVLE